MDFGNILAGFNIALSPINIFCCFMGVVIGTLVGVLPGIGPVGGIALLLPVTFGLEPVSGLIMLAGIYYGTMYGGSTTSILINVPGEIASVVTTLDGYQMALKGRAGPALGIAAIGSFIAGTLATIGLMLVAEPLSSFALNFGPPEYFSLMVLGLTLVIYLGSKSILKALIMAAFGLMISVVGSDPAVSVPRFTFDSTVLWSGVDFVPLVMGLFAISEILLNAEESLRKVVVKTNFSDLWPSKKDLWHSKGAIFRGSILGFIIGALPGGGAVIASFVSYAVEKKISKYPEKFGTGVIEGVAGPESANNSAAGGALVPLLTLGIPSNPVTALMLGALILHGLRPGPMLLSENPDFFWGVVASLYLGNILLLALNLPLVGIWASTMRIPYVILLPLIVLFCTVGTYSINNRIIDLWMMLIFGVIGYLLRKSDYPLAPVVLAVVLGPMMELAFRQSLVISKGDLSIFFSRYISLVLLLVAFCVLIIPFVKWVKGKKGYFVEDLQT